jgi:hypothetical protein
MKTIEFAGKVRNKLNNINVDDIIPFREQPHIESNNRMTAHDLFSHFTEGIIKKHVKFTR